MITNCPISIIGPEAMGFHYGLPLMQHPLGPKPWSRKFLKEVFTGWQPRTSDLSFWKNVNGEIKPYSDSYVKRKIFVINLCRFIGRFYAKK
jgi:hypothetical protein